MSKLREQTAKEDLELKKKLMADGPQASYGYGGKFGVQADRYAHSFVCIVHVDKNSLFTKAWTRVQWGMST